MNRDETNPLEGGAGDLLAVCGLYCGACYHYRAARPDGAHLLTEASRGGRPLAGHTCHGCRSDCLYIHPGCADCAIRDCADAHGFDHCGECGTMPCELLTAFRLDGRRHHLDIVDHLCEARSAGTATWLACQAARWQCSACGAPYSWYEATCDSCGAPLDSYG